MMYSPLSGEKAQPPLLSWLFGISRTLSMNTSPIHLMRPGFPAPHPPANQNMLSHALAAAHWLSLGEGEWVDATSSGSPSLTDILFLYTHLSLVNFGLSPEAQCFNSGASSFYSQAARLHTNRACGLKLWLMYVLWDSLLLCCSALTLNMNVFIIQLFLSFLHYIHTVYTLQLPISYTLLAYFSEHLRKNSS